MAESPVLEGNMAYSRTRTAKGQGTSGEAWDWEGRGEVLQGLQVMSVYLKYATWDKKALRDPSKVMQVVLS